ncbi:MAG: DMT family transporter [Bacteroidetes bacterium]|nr:DMT family transporter [Bacteroidota bacterium]
MTNSGGNSGAIWAHFALFTVGAIYAGNYIVAKGLMPDIVGPSGFIVLRVVGGTAMFFTVMLILRVLGVAKIERIARADFPRLILCGLSGVAINQLCFFNGLALTSPIHASLIMTVNPIFVLLISAIFLSNKITARKIAGICIGGTGAGLLLLFGGQASDVESGASWEGDLLVLINAFAYGVYLVAVKPLMSKYHPLTIISWVFLFGMVFVLPIGMDQVLDIQWALLERHHFQAIVYVILGTTFLAYLLNIFALNNVSPVVVSIYIYLQPLIVVLLVGILAFVGSGNYHNDINSFTCLFAFAIFTGVWLVSVPKGWIMERIKG